MKQKTVCVIGLGYIGLPTATFIANAGYKVFGTDIIEDVIEKINDCKSHIFEPGLETLVSKAVTSKNLQAYKTVQPADIYMICVPTPFKKDSDDFEPDMSYVFNAVDGIIPHLKDNDLIILESTSPVGTSEEIENYIINSGIKAGSFGIGYCPERVLPGKIIEEFISNDRIIGGNSEQVTVEIAEFYKSFTDCNLHYTNSKTAEMSKLAENSFRDVNIAFANELSMICDEEGIDIWELISLTNHHPRVNILQPGTGVGGHCISVDPWFIVAKNSSNAKLIKKARIVNNKKPKWVIRNILHNIDSFNLKNGKLPIVALYGLSFKPDIDDLRESPAIQVAKKLSSNKELELIYVEPNIKSLDLFKIDDFNEAIKKADLHIFLVAHSEFKEPSFVDKLNGLNVIDYCGVFQR